MNSVLYVMSQYQVNSLADILEELMKIDSISGDVLSEAKANLEELRNSETMLVSEYLEFNKQQEEEA